MNGSAPNSPATGSQISVRQKLRPNFSIDSIDCRVSSNPMAHDDQHEDERKRARPHPEPEVACLACPARHA